MRLDPPPDLRFYRVRVHDDEYLVAAHDLDHMARLIFELRPWDRSYAETIHHPARLRRNPVRDNGKPPPGTARAFSHPSALPEEQHDGHQRIPGE